MSYIKPGGRTWIKTELNDLPSMEVENYNWLVRSDPALHIRSQHHQSWCEDENCGSLRPLSSRHLDGGDRSTTT